MKERKEKIKLSFDGDVLDAMRGITSYFDQCGKVSHILLSAHGKQKNIKLTDDLFDCVYNGLCGALESDRYPTKAGKEYNSLIRAKKLFEREYLNQRGCNLHFENEAVQNSVSK